MLRNKDSKLIAVPLTLEEKQLNELNEHVQKNGKTRTKAIRIAIERYLKTEGSDDKNK